MSLYANCLMSLYTALCDTRVPKVDSQYTDTLHCVMLLCTVVNYTIYHTAQYNDSNCITMPLHCCVLGYMRLTMWKPTPQTIVLSWMESP